MYVCMHDIYRHIYIKIRGGVGGRWQEEKERDLYLLGMFLIMTVVRASRIHDDDDDDPPDDDDADPSTTATAASLISNPQESLLMLLALLLLLFFDP